MLLGSAGRLWGSCAVVLAIAALVGVGCRRNSSGASAASTKTKSTSTATASNVEDQLKTALVQLQPENLNITSHVSNAVSVLNHWWGAVKGAKLEPTGVTPPAIPDGLLPEVVRQQLQREAFSSDDGRHIRASYLAKQIADDLAAKTDNDLERVVLAFEWTCRNIVLLNDDEPAPALSFYELAIFGRGRPEDRATVFANLLRQWRLDAVVLRPEGEVADDSPWIIGVLLDDAVYLFDVRLGLPLPRGDRSLAARITEPATLADLLQHPEWLKALTVRSDQPYAPTIEQLQSPEVEIIASIVAWSPRMWNIEQMLPGDRLCVLYDAPAPIGDAPGVFQRLAAAFPAVSLERIQPWRDLWNQEARFAQGDRQTQQILQVLQATMAVPIEKLRDSAAVMDMNWTDPNSAARRNPTAEDGKKERYGPSFRQLKTRTLQLQGRYADAIAQYVGIRQLGMSPPPDPNVAVIYNLAAEDAFYWSGVCKAESGQYDSAATALTEYMRRHQRGGRWLAAARQLIADCRVAENKLPEAIAALKLIVPNDSYRASVGVQLKRLTALSAVE